METTTRVLRSVPSYDTGNSTLYSPYSPDHINWTLSILLGVVLPPRKVNEQDPF